MKSFYGKTVQDAIKAGLKELDISIDEAEIKIIDEGSKGIFGIGSKKAHIKMGIFDEDVLENKSVIEDVFETVIEHAKEEFSDFKKAATEVANDVKHELDDVSKDLSNEFTEIKKAATDAKEKAKKDTVSAIEKIQDSLENVKTKFSSIDEENNKQIEEFLLGLFEKMGIEASLSFSLCEDNTLVVNIKSENTGTLIGYRGDTLDAIQYLTRLIARKANLPYKSIIVQTENYREKREETLRQLAQRLANKVERTGKKVVLEPMKPYERRIIHETLQEYDKITTWSEGIEPKRHIVIGLKK